MLLSDNNVLEMNFFSTYVVYFVPMGLLSLVCLAVLSLLPQNRSNPDLTLLHTPITPGLITQFDYALRSPINAVLGMGNILLNTPLAPQQREYLNNLNLASHDLLHVVDEMALRRCADFRQFRSAATRLCFAGYPCARAARFANCHRAQTHSPKPRI